MKRIIAAILLALSAACTQVDTGNIGVEATLGQVKPDQLPAGVYFTIFKTVYEVSGKENVVELNDLKPKTSDNITLADLDINVYYLLAPNAAAKVMVKYASDMVKNKDGDYVVGSGLVARLAREAAYKAAALQHSSTAHTKRDDIAADTLRLLRKELAESAPDLFVVTNVIVRNLVTDPGLEQSIKASAQVEFNIRQKKQQIELEKSEAERRRVEAEGVAKANEIIARSLTPQLLEMRRIETLAGFAKTGNSTVVLQAGATPLIQVK